MDFSEAVIIWCAAVLIETGKQITSRLKKTDPDFHEAVVKCVDVIKNWDLTAIRASFGNSVGVERIKDMLDGYGNAILTEIQDKVDLDTDVPPMAEFLRSVLRTVATDFMTISTLVVDGKMDEKTRDFFEAVYQKQMSNLFN